MTDERKRPTRPAFPAVRPHRTGPVPKVRPDAVLAEADALAATFDDREATPVEDLIERADAVIDALEHVAAEKRSIDVDAKRAELEYLPGAIWKGEVDQRLADVEAAIARPTRRALLWKLAQAIGVGGVVTALVLAARALIAHGDATAESRHLAETIRKLVDDVHTLQLQQAKDDEAHGRRTPP